LEKDRKNHTASISAASNRTTQLIFRLPLSFLRPALPPGVEWVPVVGINFSEPWKNAPHEAANPSKFFRTLEKMVPAIPTIEKKG
jgi:hypothetical protein